MNSRPIRISAIGFARVGEPMRQSVDELRTSIDRRFEETNPEYHVVFEPIDFTQWFDLANEHREQGGPRRRQPSTGHSPSHLTRTWSALTVRTTISRAFSRALDGYVDCVAATERDADAVTDAVAFHRAGGVGNTVPRGTLREGRGRTPGKDR